MAIDRLSEAHQKMFQDYVRTMLALIGDDPDREGLRETPERVVRAWLDDWGRSYRDNRDPSEILKLFDPKPHHPETDLAFPNITPLSGIHPDYNEMVIERDITVFSHCEHHLAPFFGIAHLAYVPSRKGITGLSKLARIVDFFSRRLQTQERLTSQIADCLALHLSPDIGVRIECRHLCMISRGAMQPHATTITTSLKGAFFSKPEARAEFLQACLAPRQAPY
jgi:GTP cyclohydrolase IA